MSDNFNWKGFIEVIFIAIVLITFLFSLVNYFHKTDNSFTGEKIIDKESDFVSILQKSEKDKSSVPPPNIPVQIAQGGA